MTHTAALGATQKHARVAPSLATGPAPLHACSICLRVRHRGHWIEVESAIQLVRSFESEIPPRLLPALCDSCAAAIAVRRGRKARRDEESSVHTEAAFSKAVLRFNDRPTLANFALYRLVSRELELARKRARSVRRAGLSPNGVGRTSRPRSEATS